MIVFYLFFLKFPPVGSGNVIFIRRGRFLETEKYFDPYTDNIFCDVFIFPKYYEVRFMKTIIVICCNKSIVVPIIPDHPKSTCNIILKLKTSVIVPISTLLMTLDVMITGNTQQNTGRNFPIGHIYRIMRRLILMSRHFQKIILILFSLLTEHAFSWVCIAVSII